MRISQRTAHRCCTTSTPCSVFSRSTSLRFLNARSRDTSGPRGSSAAPACTRGGGRDAARTRRTPCRSWMCTGTAERDAAHERCDQARMHGPALGLGCRRGWQAVTEHRRARDPTLSLNGSAAVRTRSTVIGFCARHRSESRSLRRVVRLGCSDSGRSCRHPA